MKKKKTNNGIFYVVISLVAVLGIGSIALGYTMSQNINVAGDYINNEAPSEAPVVDGDVQLGGSPGPDRYSYQFCDNEICDVPVSVPFTQIGTSTVCSIKSPTASSTLLWASFKMSKATSTAQVVQVGNGGQNYAATTTKILDQTIAAGDTAAIIMVATTSTSALFDDSEYLNFRTANGLNTGIGVDGECKAIFRVLDN